MADKIQLISQLRFALEQLSERNAQHEWEHLCRHLARERICANILPATGPVQAGGDQGRDFETFRTYLQTSSLKTRSFIGLVSMQPLAFACTLEKSLPPKVRRDVATIMSSGILVEGIYIFCSRGLPVAKRHELQKWCQSDHGVHLEIFDGEAIAELLSDYSLYWLAERYLQMPSELLPPQSTSEHKNWYAITLIKWRQNPTPARTFADFTEIRAAARYARGAFQYKKDGTAINRYEHPELPFWISRLDELAEHTMQILSRRAFYEASVLRLRSTGSLHGQEERLRDFFGALQQLKDTAELEDAEILLTYLFAAQSKGEVGLAAHELSGWASELSKHIDDRIRQAKKDDRKNEWCALLDIRAHLAIFSRFEDGVLCASDAFRYWTKLVKLAAHAPLFPLERFADRLSEMARYLGTYPDYEVLTQSVDALIATRFGQFKAAEKCLARAKVFFDAGDLSRAMAQLHQAKLDWFAEETLEKTILAMRLLSDAYMKQGLFFAAKYYSLAVSYLVLHSSDLDLKLYIASALAEAAKCDYALGAWHGFLELAEIGVIVYPHFAPDPDFDFNTENGVLQEFLFPLCVVPVITKSLHPQIETFARERSSRVLRRLGFDNAFTRELDIDNVWGNRQPKEVWTIVQDQLAGPPWSDAGVWRHAQWSAHGVHWQVQWRNDYNTTLVAEEFLSGLQIFLSDLAGYDLCLLRSKLHITLQVAASSEHDAQIPGYQKFNAYFEPSNAERQATVVLPPHEFFKNGKLSHNDILVGTISVISSLLAEASLLPTERFHQVLEERFAQGLKEKLFIAAPYSQCLNAFVSEEDFVLSSRASHAPSDAFKTFLPKPSEKLPWFNGPGPGYNEKTASQMIQNRYNKFSHPIRLTLERLSRDPGFQVTLACLRRRGWKDWHILSMVFHVTMNYRMDQSNIIFPKNKTEMETQGRMFQRSEAADAPVVPIDQYSEENLRQQLPFYIAAFIKTFSLEFHQRTLNVPGLEDFVAERYNFWSDDIEHIDYFNTENT